MTRKIVSILSAAALLSVGAFAQAAATNAAPATTANSVVAGPTKVAIINIQAAIANTNEGQRDLEALQKKFEPRQIELKSLSDEVDNLKKQLAAQTDKLNDDERNKRVQAIESKQKTLQRNLDDAQSEYQSQSNDIAQRIGTKVFGVLQTYAKQNAYSVVIDTSTQQSPVLCCEQADITRPVIEAYNVQSGVPAPTATKPAAAAPSASAPSRRPTTTPATPKPTAANTTPR